MISKRDILKSNIVLGASQVVQMVVTIVRTKMIAIILGSQGMAYNAIYQSLLQMIYNIASCGLMQSGVREISRVYSPDKQTSEFKTVLSVFGKLVLLFAVIGFLSCAILSFPLSFLSFGDSAHVVGFVILGVGVFLYILSHGEMTVLQGVRSHKKLAYSTISGSVFSLIISIPSYYYLGINGVVFSIVLGYGAYWLSYKYFRGKLKFCTYSVGLRQALKEGRPMIELGVILMLGTALVSIFTYLTNITIRTIGNLEDVGLFQGTASLVTQSIAVIFAVLASDFFPRLSALTECRSEKNDLINQQLTIVIPFIAAIVTFILCFPEFLIRLLLSEEFLVTSTMLQLMAVSLIFRGIWMTMSYVILAHGDRKRYLLYDAVLGNGLTYVINIIAYKLGGLSWLGFSYLLSSVFVSMLLFFVASKSYNFRASKSIVKLCVFMLVFLTGIFVLRKEFPIIGLCLGVITVMYCIYRIFSGSGLIQMIKNKIK